METISPESVENTGNEAPPPAPQGNWKRLVLDILETVLLSAVLFLVINTLTARVRVDGFSMRPTLDDGQFVLVNRLAYQFDEPRYGDIVVFHYPLSPNQDLIKRVIGLPGDTVRITGGQVYVNGAILDEPYIAAAPRYDVEWNVPEGHLFVLGDNRNDSNDSHSWGPLQTKNVIGKAVLVYWPFDKFSLIDHTDVAMAAQE